MLYYTGYDSVRRNLSKITEALKATPGAKGHLIVLYMQHGWLNYITENPAEDELVSLALQRIKQDPNQYDLFIDMLRDIPGMDLIVAVLTRDLRSSTYHIQCTRILVRLLIERILTQVLIYKI